LTRGKEPVTIVILGISHALSSTPFILTTKDFDTPLGLVETDREAVERLGQDLPFDPYRDEYNHLSEHSVEFHAVVLKRLMKDRPFKIVPVLCCSFHQAISDRCSPLGLPGVREFVKNLDTLKNLESVHFLASVDLAHMGVQFGGKPLSRQFLSELERRDLESLAGMTEGDADRFFATHQADGGERNYCGTPAIYTLLTLFPERFTLHRYQQCTDPDLGSTVTVCAATLGARDN
jgi:AmmeMemoRadiSam system protein B